MHGNHDLCAEVEKCAESLLGAGVDRTVAVGEIGADGEQGNLGAEPVRDLGKAAEVRRIA